MGAWLLAGDGLASLQYVNEVENLKLYLVEPIEA